MSLSSQEAQEIYTKLGGLTARVEELQRSVKEFRGVDKAYSEQFLQLNSLVAQLSDQLQTVPNEDFLRNHRFVSALIEQQEARVKFWSSLQEKLAMSGILRLAMVIGAAAWAAGSEALSNFWQHFIK